MRMIISILTFLVFTATAAVAGSPECGSVLTEPDQRFVQAVNKQHTGLSEAETVLLAHMYELAYNQLQLAGDETLTEQNREFAKRTHDISLRIAAVQLHVFETLPQMEFVLERMQAEKAEGLKQVSAELEPDVRRVARSMLAIGIVWGDLGNDVVQLSTDRFTAIAEGGNVTDALHRTMCTLESVVDVMEGVADIFPNAAILAYVERLNY